VVLTLLWSTQPWLALLFRLRSQPTVSELVKASTNHLHAHLTSTCTYPPDISAHMPQFY